MNGLLDGRSLSGVAPDCECSSRVINVTEAGETRRFNELSPNSEISLSKIHQHLGSVQALFLENHAVHSVSMPVRAQLWQNASTRFHWKLCARLLTRKQQNCEDLG